MSEPQFDPQEAASFDHFNGKAYKWRFDNGVSISVVRHEGSYGGPEGFFEMMIGYSPEMQERIPTDLGQDVRGWMTESQVNDTNRYLKGLT